jgi:hypothetical protein
MNLIGIAIALIGYGISILEYIKEPRISKRLIIMIVLSTLALGITVWDLQKQENEKLAHSTSGMISGSSPPPSWWPFPSNWQLKPKNIDYPCILLGNGLLFSSEGPTRLTPIDFGSGKIDVRTENRQLKVSSIVRDKDSKVVAIINDNEWDVPPQAQIVDRNFDERAFEVIDAYNRTVMQVSMVGECATLSGIFYKEDGSAAVIANGGVYFAPPGEDIPYDIIKPIFRYPSDRHLGERINK